MPLTDGIAMPNCWRLDAEMFTGSETFHNHFDVMGVGAHLTIAPLVTDAVVTAFEAWLIGVFFPDVTINTITLREILRYTTPPPHVDHPPLWTKIVNTIGTANILFGGAHFAGFLPQQACIFVKKTTSGGRSGKMFMRNIITEADVQSTLGGTWVFSPHAGGFDPAVFDAFAASTLGPNLVGGSDAGNYELAVTHLEHVAITDTRPITSTPCGSVLAVRPAWNKTSR